MDRNGAMTSGQVHRATGASRARLRHWQAIGIISPELEEHNSRTWRVYPPELVDRIHGIMELLAQGYSLGGAARRIGAQPQAATDRSSGESVGA